MQESTKEHLVKGQDIISEIVKNMHEGLEPLHYTTLIPSLYHVYLHTEDYERLKGVFPQIIDEAKRVLAEELERMNKRNRPPRIIQSLRIPRKNTMKFINAQDGWYIDFYENTDGETQRGDIVIHSELALPPKTEYGAGSRTKRIATRLTGGKTTAIHSYEDSETRRSSDRTYARIAYEDSLGKQTYLVDKSQIVIGRGGRDYWVDLKLHTTQDVSREHIRLRYDEGSRQFYIKDLSRLGTTVNGKSIASSIELVGEVKRDKNIEIPLPSQARIGLAGVIFLNFEAVKE